MDNPQAFPMNFNSQVFDQLGMDLRDYFAGQALLMIDNNSKDYPIGSTLEEYQAHLAYRQADAMLAERNKND